MHLNGEWICSISVPSVNAALAASDSNKGSTLMKAKDFNGIRNSKASAIDNL